MTEEEQNKLAGDAFEAIVAEGKPLPETAGSLAYGAQESLRTIARLTAERDAARAIATAAKAYVEAIEAYQATLDLSDASALAYAALAAANARIGELEAAKPIIEAADEYRRATADYHALADPLSRLGELARLHETRKAAARAMKAAALAAPIQPEPVSRSATKRVSVLTGKPMMDGLVPKPGTPEWDAARAAHNADPATRHATPFRTAGPMAANQDATDLAREDA